MNLEESDSYKVKMEANTRHRKMVMLSIVLCAVLVAFLFFLIALINEKDKRTMKIFLNGAQLPLSEAQMEALIKDEGNDGKYFDIEYVTQIIGGYTYNKGEYKKYNEDINSCYVQSDCEIIAITADKESFTKYLDFSEAVQIGSHAGVTAKNQNDYSEEFIISKPIKNINGRLCASIDNTQKIFNLFIDWSEEYRLRIYTIDWVVNRIDGKYLSGTKYSTVSGYFENFKAYLDGYVVVEDPEHAGIFGILQIKNDNVPLVNDLMSDSKRLGTSVNLIVGTKYKEIKYIQNLKHFYITAEDNTMGLLDSEGKIIIPVQSYNKVSLLDERKQLYLVEKDRQYGVVNNKGKEVVYTEYDRIGIDITKFELDDLVNGNILFGKAIPFYKENDNGDFKYGLLDTDGNVILGNYYDDFGYKSPNTSANSTRDRSTLVIPESVGLRGIIVNRQDSYGIYDIDKEELVLPTVCSKIYVAVKEGVADYYVEVYGQTHLLKDFLISEGIIKKSEPAKSAEPKINEDVNTNTVSSGPDDSLTNTVNDNDINE